MKISEIRPEVLKFAVLMEQKLRENDWKGSWKNCTRFFLKTKLLEERAELDWEILNVKQWETNSAIRDEAIDEANILMMILDVAGQLKDIHYEL